MKIKDNDLVGKKEIVGHMLNVSNKLYAWCAGSDCNECKKVVLKRGNHYECCNGELAEIRKLLSRQPEKLRVTRKELSKFYEELSTHIDPFTCMKKWLKSKGIEVTEK